jgi:drug/metabolite transporter (DMT)-like permease
MIAMKHQNIVTMLSLGAIWGGSYVFMRLGAGEFGALTLAGLRAAGATLMLVPVLLLTKQHRALHKHWKPIAVVGVANSALPFVLFNYAALHINAGLSSVLSAAAPLFAGLIAFLWLREHLPVLRWLGLLIGFVGVLTLALSKTQASLAIHDHAQALAVGACLLAALLYGIAVNLTKKYLAGVSPMAIASGGQIASALLLMPFSVWAWPERAPSAAAWASLVALAVLCSALAYVLFFRLIARMGQTKAIAVTYLIPVFGVLWGALFLAEVPTASMVIGCLVILLGTALGSGLYTGRLALLARSGIIQNGQKMPKKLATVGDVS